MPRLPKRRHPISGIIIRQKNNRQNLNLLALDLLPENKRGSYEKMAGRYEQEKEEIKAKAEALKKNRLNGITVAMNKCTCIIAGHKPRLCLSVYFFVTLAGPINTLSVASSISAIVISFLLLLTASRAASLSKFSRSAPENPEFF